VNRRALNDSARSANPNAFGGEQRAEWRRAAVPAKPSAGRDHW
jgi:hypothetical protein